jgi:pectate lyase
LYLRIFLAIRQDCPYCQGVRRYTVALSALLLSCGVDVAQTAVLDTSVAAAPECSAPATLTAPTTEQFGVNDPLASSSLVLASYGAQAGPGVYLIARDSFRLYLNGVMIAESNAARTPIFVPLTLLPGDNEIAVVASAAQGTPAVLLQIDELLQSYFSDASWKVSTNPEGDWSLATYDDSSWSAATDFGAIGSLPGCDPMSVFPADSTAHWIGPSQPAPNAVLRTKISIRPSGFGASTRGGEGATPVLVTSVAELNAALTDKDTPAVVLVPEGLLDLRPTGTEVVQQSTCPTPCANDATKILYTVLVSGMTCPVALVDQPRDDRRIEVGSNKTIVGLGRGAALRGASFDLGSSNNVIMRNLAIFDVNPTMIEAGDAITLTAPTEVWVDHCTFKWISDGFIDAGAGTNAVTVSWSHYDGLNDYACTGHHPRASQFEDAVGTIHHSFWDHVDTHAPTVAHSTSRVHLFDNYTSDDGDYAVEASCGAQVLLEASTFENVVHPTSKTTCSDVPPALGLLRAPTGSNLYRDDVGTNRSDGADAPEPEDAVFTPPYAYSLDPPATAWVNVESRAGAGGPWAVPLSLD